MGPNPTGGTSKAKPERGAEMNRAKPITQGTWNRIARKHYRHIDGAEVRYDHNRFLWITHTNEAYSTLTVAQQVAERESVTGAISWRKVERFGWSTILVASMEGSPSQWRTRLLESESLVRES